MQCFDTQEEEGQNVLYSCGRSTCLTNLSCNNFSVSANVNIISCRNSEQLQEVCFGAKCPLWKVAKYIYSSREQFEVLELYLSLWIIVFLPFPIHINNTKYHELSAAVRNSSASQQYIK